MVESGLLTEAQLGQALEKQRQQGGKLGALLVSEGFIDEEQLLEFLSKQCGIHYISLSKLSAVKEDVIKLVPEAIARQHVLVPIKKMKNTLTIAVSDPLNVLVLDDLNLMTGLQIDVVLASEKEITGFIDRYYGSLSSQGALDEIVKQSGGGENGDGALAANVTTVEEEEEENVFNLKKMGEDAPIIQMVNLTIANAIKMKASDIHIEPFPKDLKVRYRIDGVLQVQPSPPKRFQAALISRLKIMANLDIAERRVPQDGHIKLKIDEREIDLRLSTLPTAWGEKAVMRILDSSGLKVKLEELGFEPEEMAVFERCIKAPYGINLITGPTGSGKSTTLYSALSQLNRPEVNIVTIEDPVEYQVAGINQVQVNNEAGLTFAAGLKAFLRQDPNVIMVGEIRDLETISIAINAALTGHLVFSTLHTNDAPSSVTRMGMMGVEPFLISSSVLMVVAQRLARSICPKCKEQYDVEADWLIKRGIAKSLLKINGGKVNLWRGRGCDNCAKTGYRGRLGVYEILEMTDEVRELILERASTLKIKEMARKQGMRTLREGAVRKLLAGKTTVEEMIRITASDTVEMQ